MKMVRCWLRLLAIVVISTAPLEHCVIAADNSAAEIPAGDKAADDVVLNTPAEAQDLVLLSPSRPLLVRLLVRIDGQPFREAWQLRLEKVLDETDKAKTNAFSAQQAADVVAQLVGELGSGQTANEVSDAAAKLAQTQGDKLRRDDLVRFVLAKGPPFVVQHSASIARRAGPALFPLLDTNHDGQLSAAELAGAESALRSRDFDDDGLITQQELIVDPQLAALEAAGSSESTAGKVLLAVEADGAESLTKALLARYDRNRDQRIALAAPSEIMLEAAVAEALDKNGDGYLDAAELAAFAAREADIELRFDFGKATSAGRSRAAKPTADDVSIRKKLDGGYKILVPEAEIVWHRSNRNPAQSAAQDLRFASFDPDNNGYIDEKEAKNNPFIARSFAAMDADHDAKVTRREFNDYLERESRVASVRVLLEVFDQGQDLFSMLDANGDGVLTPRELHNAPALLKTADNNGDNMLGGSEIPQQLTLEISRGVVTRANELRQARRPTAPSSLKGGKEGPLWFRKMDRNNDGDISRGEFLGPAEVFDRLDANHDGLIDESEAKAAKD